MTKREKNGTRFLVILVLVLVMCLTTACGDSVSQKIATRADVEALFDESDFWDYPTFKVVEEGEDNVYRETYTVDNNSTRPVFNSITNNPVVGDERDFVRIIEKGQIGAGGVLSNELTVEPGKEYMVAIYVRNGASYMMNSKEHNYLAVAKDTRVVATLPDELEAGVKQPIYGTVVASNANPKIVWDVVLISAEEDVNVSYVPNTAKIYNDWDLNGTVLDEELFTPDGVFIGLKGFNGVIPGGEDYVCIVCFDIKIEATG